MDIVPQSANLKGTAILDVDHEEVRSLARMLVRPDQSGRDVLQNAHMRLSGMLRPVYSVNEWQPVSKTLQKKQGSCSQRMACLEAVARVAGIATRVRALHLKGDFWYPRFRFSRPFIPKRILLVWPQFFLQGTWLDFDELYAPAAELATAAAHGFRNDGESLFEAVQKTPVDFLGKTCGLACARPEHNLSRFVLDDAGFFDTRDEAFEQFDSFQQTLRGRMFEVVYGGRKSS
ncbi:MAG TPA: transglutaminase domain-containing protein [Candidatus Acidoferrales bacterium]|nr:transglutaminase domain-containing protein [Candidatus Acidoferrales bacterium]